ncbi:NAD(P)/FAD-dependent oxidoreductase [Haliangium ochraceum]|uniref:FAD dependent oxidoreductase n=1 Tax=Haliangium ochraceum (strain DSM 14365 / JCM 11303 / SMP-2) TaxID=502025 RepID=D0LUN4_HALO1|nr:FAD-binding oxidoreductase [Haliangium ochraceum]ACY13924.1 FAD dependent oxidoreductase [Haliangium ochraceum DSM 14365]
MSKFDVCVVGNGVLGLSTARSLLLENPTLRVAVVGPGARLRGASSAAGAMLGCFGEITHKLSTSPLGRKKIDFAYQATGLWPSWIESINAELPAEMHLAPDMGTFIINNNKSGTIEDANFSAILACLEQYQAKWEDVEPSEIPGLDPAADGRPLRAIFVPGEGSLGSGRLLAALTEIHQRSSSVTLYDDEVAKLELDESKVHGVVLASDGTRIEAPVVVLAAGVASQPLLDQHPWLARRIPRVFAGGGNSVVLDTDQDVCPHTVRTPNRAFACGLHQVPRGKQRAYIGATNHITTRPFERANVSDMYFLLECAMEQLHQGYQSARLVSWHAGNRPVPIDGCPLIGKTSVDGLWMLTGTYRDGLHLSPLLTRSLASEILGGAALLEHPFAPERKPLPLYTREEAIEAAVEHYTAVGYEHKMTIPKVGWHTLFERQYRATAEAVYSAIDSPYTLPPEFVPMIDSDRDNQVRFFREYFQEVASAWGEPDEGGAA